MVYYFTDNETIMFRKAGYIVRLKGILLEYNVTLFLKKEGNVLFVIIQNFYLCISV